MTVGCALAGAVLALAVTPTAVAIARPAQDLAAAQPALPSVAATRLADRLASDALVIGQTRRALHQQLPSALKANADMQAVERQWPGVTAEFIAVMEPIIVDALSRRTPAYRRDVAAIFQKHMAEEEIAAADAFYASAVGQRVLSMTLEGVDFTDLMKRQIESRGEARVSGTEIGAAITPALQPAISGLSTEDQMRLMSFGMSPAGRKMNRLNPELLELSARFNNTADPATDAAIEKAMATLIERRMSAERRK